MILSTKKIKSIGFASILALMLLAIAACSDEPASPVPAQQQAAAASQAAPAQQQPAAQAQQQPRAAAPAAQAQPAAPAQQPQASAATSQTQAAAPTRPARAQAAPAEKIRVVTTSNIVSDWVRIVGGDRVDVLSLLPTGADPHTFQPSAQDVVAIADADLVLSVGLGLEEAWLHDLVENAARDESSVVALAERIDPLEFAGHDDHDDHDEDEDHDHDEDEDHDDHDEDEDHDDHDDHGEGLIGRLLVGDGEEGKMSVIDLESGEVEQARFDLGSRAGRIYATKSGRYAIAVSSDANAAHLFDGGIFMEPHGDHFDLVEGDIRKLPVDLSGDRPVHLYVSGEWAVIFYDGSGDVALLNEHELEESGDAYTPVVINAGPQHGGAVPLEGDLFATTIKHPEFPANADYRLPIGAEIRDLDGNILYSAEGCEGLHGDAGNGHMAIFGCVGGTLVLEAHDGEYSHVFVPAPAGSPDDFRLTSVWGYSGLDHFFALGSAVGLYIVEPEEGEMEQFIPSTEQLSPIQVSLGQGGETLFVVMSDGELRMYDAHDLDLLASNADFLTAPVETGFWARPHIATAGDAVFVTDSVGGEVLQLDVHDLEVVMHWDVDGTPTKIAFVGILDDHDGEYKHEGHDEHEDHDEDEDHDEHEDHDEDEDHDDHDHMEDPHAGHDHGPDDPHFWFDPLRVKFAVNDIAARLSVLDPDGRNVFNSNAAAFNSELNELHFWTQEQVSTVPDDRRLLVTSHDSFGYFADLYGFEVVGLVIPSLSTDVEPSAEHIAGVIEAVRDHKIPAVFGETTVSERMAKTIANETGAELVRLYTGSLGEDGSGAETYIDMIRVNVERIVGALK